MPKEFTISPVSFPSSGPSPTTTTTTTPNPNMLHHRQLPTAPFQPQHPSSSLPFMSFDISSTTPSSSFPPPHHIPSSSSSSSSPLFSSEPPLLEELEINPSLIWYKTRSLLNPFRLNSSLHLDPDLSGPFLYYIAFALFQLLADKVQFGVILGWIAISSIFLYTILNFLAGRNGNLDLYRCFSVVGYCLMPIVIYSASSLFLPSTGTTPGFIVAAVFVIWATRVCSRLLTVDEFGASENLLASREVYLSVRDVVRKGDRKMVGKGSSIDIWRDPWIPNMLDFKALPRLQTMDEAIKVISDLMCEGSWNAEILSDSFSRWEVNEIAKICIALFCGEDSWTWHHSDNGEFSVKSAYYVELAKRDPSCASSSVSPNNWVWKNLWATNVLPKINIVVGELSMVGSLFAVI